jgi:PiT family inorganic phosphate transporter
MGNHFLILVFSVILIVVLFEFVNGFNDFANMAVMPIITGAMEPKAAIFIISSFEFIGAWFLGTAVAQTLGKGIVNPQDISIAMIFAAILGAIAWDFGAWRLGMPFSASHALIGGFVGAMVVGAGPDRIHWEKVLAILLILIVTPGLGLIAGHYITKWFSFLFGDFKPSKANKFLRRMQIITSAALAMSYGSNDAQKGMSIISLALIFLYRISPSFIEKIYNPMPDLAFYVPKWVVILCSLSLALGSSIGGWRIMKTLGTKLFKVRPIHGFSAQACSTAIISISSVLGFPVSTTQIVSSSILGAGSAQSIGRVRWAVGKHIFFTWIITIPGSAILSALFFILMKNWI